MLLLDVTESHQQQLRTPLEDSVLILLITEFLYDTRNFFNVFYQLYKKEMNSGL